MGDGRYDPTQNTLAQAFLLARADARQFTLTVTSGGSQRTGTHPDQARFAPVTQSVLTGSWSAVYRGERLQGPTLVTDAVRAAEHTASILGNALDTFDLMDLRRMTQGMNPNTYAPDYVPPQAITVYEIDPNTGNDDGSTLVLMKGAGFARAVRVWFGKQAAYPVVLHDATLTVVPPPSLVDGPVDVRVESVDGHQYDAVIKAGYTYFASLRIGTGWRIGDGSIVG